MLVHAFEQTVGCIG